jgi:hypothetical protein
MAMLVVTSLRLVLLLKLDIGGETSGEINAQEGGEGGLAANRQNARFQNVPQR